MAGLSGVLTIFREEISVFVWKLLLLFLVGFVLFLTESAFLGAVISFRNKVLEILYCKSHLLMAGGMFSLV